MYRISLKKSVNKQTATTTTSNNNKLKGGENLISRIAIYYFKYPVCNTKYQKYKKPRKYATCKEKIKQSKEVFPEEFQRVDILDKSLIQLL